MNISKYNLYFILITYIYNMSNIESFDVYIKDGEKAVIVLEETDEWRAYVASQFASWVSAKSNWRFSEQEELVNNWFGLYRAEAEKFEEDYDYEDTFNTLKKAIAFVKKYNKESGATPTTNSTPCTNKVNMNINILNSNPEETMSNKSVIAQFEIEAFFNKDNLAKASKTLKDVNGAVKSFDRVIELLVTTREKLESLGGNIEAYANAKDVEGTQKALDRANKVLSALTSNDVFKYQLDLGNTKLEWDVKTFNAEEFLAE